MTKTSQGKSLFGKGVSRICAVSAAPMAAEMAKLVRDGLRETSTIELRLDWLRSDAERSWFLFWLKAHRPRGATFLATCRRRAGGGRFAGSVEEELAWLARAHEAGCAWCDLEIETLRKLPGGSALGLKKLPRILLSLHDFRRMPPRLNAVHSAAHRGVDAVKIAARAHTIGDSLRLLRLARRSSKLVAVPMGEAGLPARILALREGSALAYAPVGAATAPGQVSLHDLKKLYRAHELTQRTRIYGVIGDPIGHSLSPLLHNTGFIVAKVDAVYLPFLVHDLRDFLRAVPELGIRGFSVTIPHKQSILRHLKECDPLAAEIGAVNTVVVRRDGSLFGCNTDQIGILRALNKKLKLAGSRVLIFGAGGTARAAAFALAKAGAKVEICARREKAARELAKAAGGETIPRRALRSEFFDAILNTTPVGMHPHDRVSPLDLRELNCRLVMDLISRPHETQLLKLAASKGIATVSGVEMFIPQGVAQWELWLGKRAPEAAMRKAVLQALRAEENSRQHS
ncbi:MAG: shikimate dehydrogenase [Candidatus Acidiferrum sp.]